MRIQKILVLLLSVCILISAVSPGTAAEAEEAPAVKVFQVSESLGLSAANVRCTLRVFRPGTDISDGTITPDQMVYLAEETASETGSVSFSFPLSGSSGSYPYLITAADRTTRRGNLYLVNAGESTANQAYDLIDDDFNMLKANSGDPLDLWGWDVLEDGGTFDYSAQAFLMKDTSSSKRLKIRRTFEHQSGNRLRLEFRFRQDTLQNDARWELCNGEDAVIQLSTRDGALYSENTYLMPYQAGTDYGVQLEIDLAAQSFQVFVNGSEKAQGVKFLSLTSAVDNLVVSTGKTATGNMNFKPVRLSRDYLVRERWIAYGTGALQNGSWQTSDGNVTIQSMTSVTPPDTYSAVLTPRKGGEPAWLKKQIKPIQTGLEWEFKFLAPDGIGALTASLSDALRLKIEQNRLYVQEAGGGRRELCELIPNLWYTVSCTLDAGTGKAVIMVNGKKKAGGVQTSAANTSVSEILFQTGAGQPENVWIDDIILKPSLPLPEDYVPVPKVQDKAEGEPLVGIQTCDLWHEGKHFGWDKINQDPLRKPYLGYYDDGNSEVKDWEIKYMAEHGIDFSLHCWYRPSGGTGKPIKDPRNGASIHDGLFHAQYRDKIKFAIAWENGSGSSTNETDFRENIVPFWMEYYFKDSGYLLVDNKPVIGFYNVNGLIASFGKDQIKPQLDYLRQACMDAGFDGACILGVSGSANAGTLQEFKSFGFDALYCYSWGTGGYMAEAQKASMTAQQNTGALPVIPTLAMGRDDTPWNRSGGGYLAPGELKSLAQWAKDVFMPAEAAGSLGRRMVMLDNWNEYGEGHFYMPSELAGFDYLEAIGQVFGQPAHEDIRPTERQRSRLCRLYDRNRTVPELIYPAEQLVYPYVTHGWYFDSGTEGFTKRWNVTGFKAEDGILSGVGTNTDPSIYTPDDLHIPIDDVSYLRIRMKNGTSDYKSKLYFTTEADTAENEAKAITWMVGKNMDGFIDYLVPVYKNAAWKGYLKQIRFDPADQPGSFAYDSIELLRNLANVGDNLIPNGNQEAQGLPAAQGMKCGISGWEFRSGRKSLRAETDGQPGALTYELNLKAGKYLIAGSAKSGGKPLEADFILSYTADGQIVEQALGALAPGSGEWEYFGTETDVIGTDVKDGMLKIRIQTADAICYLDDLMVCRIPEIELTEAGFYDSEDRLITSMPDADGRITYKVTAENLTDAPVTVSPWIAVYKDNLLWNLSPWENIMISAGEKKELVIETQAQGCDRCRQGIWLESMQPLTEISELK